MQKEEKKKTKEVGGKEKTVTSYTYSKTWAKNPIDSKGWTQKDDVTGQPPPENKGSKTFPDANYQANEVKLGAFKLTADQLKHITDSGNVPATPEMLTALPEETKKQLKERGHELKVTSDGFFYEAFDPKGDPNSPQIGDVVAFLSRP